MHQSSIDRMRRFAARIEAQFAGRPVRVLDVGSMGVNGTYKELFGFPGVEYVGLDIAPGLAALAHFAECGTLPAPFTTANDSD